MLVRVCVCVLCDTSCSRTAAAAGPFGSYLRTRSSNRASTKYALGADAFSHPADSAVEDARPYFSSVAWTKGVSRRNHTGPMTRAWCRGAHESYQARGSCRWSCPARQRCVRLYRRCAARRHAPRWTSCHSGAPPREVAPRGKIPTGKPRYWEPRP